MKVIIPYAYMGNNEFESLLGQAQVTKEVLVEKGDLKEDGLSLRKPRFNGFQNIRRLNDLFVQESARRKVEEVDEWLVMGDETIFVRTITEPVSLAGRITRRKHSHDRSWGERYGDFRSWSVFVGSSGILDGDDHYWAFDRFYNRVMNVVPARKKDWTALRKLNASRPEPTIASIATFRNVSG